MLSAPKWLHEEGKCAYIEENSSEVKNSIRYNLQDLFLEERKRKRPEWPINTAFYCFSF